MILTPAVQNTRCVVDSFTPLTTCLTRSQGESELVAKDDNLDAADPNKDKKTEDKDQQMDAEEKEKINEQGDQVTFITRDLLPYLLVGISSHPYIICFTLLHHASQYNTLLIVCCILMLFILLQSTQYHLYKH